MTDLPYLMAFNTNALLAKANTCLLICQTSKNEFIHLTTANLDVLTAPKNTPDQPEVVASRPTFENLELHMENPIVIRFRHDINSAFKTAVNLINIRLEF